MITALSQTSDDNATVVTATSDLAAPFYFFWYQDGAFVGSIEIDAGESGSWTFLATGPTTISVLDSTDPAFDPLANAPAAFPATRTLGFVRSLDAGMAGGQYRIEQQENSGDWDVLTYLPHTPSAWFYNFQTDRLDDLSTYAWRVIPMSAGGDDGTEIAIVGERVVRTPDAPIFTVSIGPMGDPFSSGFSSGFGSGGSGVTFAAG